jgi:hypothetical protein
MILSFNEWVLPRGFFCGDDGILFGDLERVLS